MNGKGHVQYDIIGGVKLCVLESTTQVAMDAKFDQRRWRRGTIVPPYLVNFVSPAIDSPKRSRTILRSTYHLIFDVYC